MARLYKKVQSKEKPESCRKPAVYVEAKPSLYPMPDVIDEPSGKQSFVMAGANRLARIEHREKASDVGNWFFYLKDHLQSSDVIIAADGTAVEQMAYKPYGDELEPGLSYKWQEHLKTDAKGKTPLERTHHRYTGHYLDDDTGLYYAGARYYDAKTGRFTSPDPLYVSKPESCVANTISCNLYAYAANNPMSKVDPTGLAEQRWYERTVSYIPVVGSTIDAVRSGYDAYQDIKAGNYRSAMMNGGMSLLNATSAVMEASSLGAGSIVKNIVKETVKNVASGIRSEGIAAFGETIGGEKGRMIASIASTVAGNATGVRASHASRDKVRSDGSHSLSGGYARRNQNPGDKDFTSERNARREAFRQKNVPTSRPNNYTVEAKYGNNPNLLGANGEPYHVIRTKDVNGKDVVIERHSNGHVFEDNKTYEKPHYQGSNGEHFNYD